MDDKLERCASISCGGFKHCTDRVFDCTKDDCRECNNDAQGAIEDSMCLNRINVLDSELQHLKYFFEGYRDFVLIKFHGEQKAEDVGVDTQKYSPGSARQISYEEGYKKAENDFMPL